MAKREKKEGKKVDPNAWMMTYSDLVTLLMATFVLLISIAEQDGERIRRAIGSLRESRASLGLMGRGMTIMTDKSVEGEDALNAIDVNLIHEEVSRSLTKMGFDKDAVDVFEDERRLVISLNEKVLFESGKGTISPSIFAFLNDIGDLVKRVGIPLTIQGHSDSTPTRGDPDNWQLSATRAASVYNYMVQGVGIEKKWVFAESFEGNRPVASNLTKRGRARNRRVDLVFYKRDIARLNELTQE